MQEVVHISRIVTTVHVPVILRTVIVEHVRLIIIDKQRILDVVTCVSVIPWESLTQNKHVMRLVI
jgi:hypothetical protein